MKQMRINPKMYFVPGEDQPFEVQEFDNRKIELFYMDDYEQILREQINKGKLAVWSSSDGVNYRLFLEKGFYETVKELYTPKINKIWVDFWDTSEKIQRKLTNLGLLPIGGVSIIVCVVCSMLGTDIGNTISFIALIVAFLAMLIVNKTIKSKIYVANKESRDLIVKELGETKFDGLLDAQKEYIDAYYDALYQDDEEVVETEEITTESNEEKSEEK